MADVPPGQGRRLIDRARERGQTTTEYLMISGLMTTIAIYILRYMQEPFRQRFQQIVQYIIDAVADPPW
jgi:hypothetical protein